MDVCCLLLLFYCACFFQLLPYIWWMTLNILLLLLLLLCLDILARRVHICSVHYDDRASTVVIEWDIRLWAIDETRTCWTTAARHSGSSARGGRTRGLADLDPQRPRTQLIPLLPELDAHLADKVRTSWQRVTRSTQPCTPPGSLNRVPASAGVKAGVSPLPGGR